MKCRIRVTAAIAFILIAGAAWARGADSLYTPNSFKPLTSDVRLRRVGDLITVMVYENASASSAANTTASRDANVAFGVKAQSHDYAGAIKASNHSDGGGRTEREGKVLAQITVSVKQIMPNGDLLVAGDQILDINNERQNISVEGRIRPEDVSETNVVLSTRIANARISYAGQGDMSDKQRPAWWQRLLTLFGA